MKNGKSKIKRVAAVGLKRGVMPPAKLAAFIRNPETVWYGPYECAGCGVVIVKSSNDSGGVELDARFNHHYPNYQWKQHQCVGGRGKAA
jgi:hypothetical protein